MKLDGAIFAIEQRTVGGCIDLAIIFVREHLAGVLQLLSCFALPSLAFSWWLMERQEWTLFGLMLLFALECPFFGSALVAAAGNRMFGDQFSAWQGLRSLWKRLSLFSLLIVVARLITWLGTYMMIVPGYLVATRYGFLSEVLFLEACPAKRYEKRLNDLMHASFANLLGRLVAIMTFFWVCVGALFILVDLGCGTLFNYPILIGRLTDMEYIGQELEALLTRDPRVALTLLGLCWLIYPVTRLAWTFCYLDTRIRKEGWDVEIDFRVEARRLEGVL